MAELGRVPLVDPVTLRLDEDVLPARVTAAPIVVAQSGGSYPASPPAPVTIYTGSAEPTGLGATVAVWIKTS